MWTEKILGREKDHEGGGDISAGLLDVKSGTQPRKKELWLNSQTQGPETFYSQSCQTPGWLIFQAEPDITTSFAEAPGGQGSSPSSEPGPRSFQGEPASR